MKKVFFCFHLCQNKVWLICIVTPVVSWVFLSKGFSKEKGQMMEWIQLDTNFYVHSFRMNWQYILPFYFRFVVYTHYKMYFTTFDLLSWIPLFFIFSFSLYSPIFIGSCLHFCKLFKLYSTEGGSPLTAKNAFWLWYREEQQEAISNADYDFPIVRPVFRFLAHKFKLMKLNF